MTLPIRNQIFLRRGTRGTMAELRSSSSSSSGNALNACKSAAIWYWAGKFEPCIYRSKSHSSHSLPLPGMLLAGSSFIMLSTSPTCFLSEISRLFNLDRMLAMLTLLRLPYANLRDDIGEPSLMALVGCHCKGSEELDNLFR